MTSKQKLRMLLAMGSAVIGIAALAISIERSALTSKLNQSTASFKTIEWIDLIPNDWSPSKQNGGVGTGSLSYGLSDSDPRSRQSFREMQAAYDNAPTVDALNEQAVSISGYLVPLDPTQETLNEFLLVPYFGACLHTPPPPANQIIHVFLNKPSAELRTMDVVTVTGILRTQRKHTEMGMSGYRLIAVRVTPYESRK